MGRLPATRSTATATARGLANALIEIRQDLIADDAGAAEWAARFARLLRPLLARPDLREPVSVARRARGTACARH